jgi:hypothetical protein
MTGILLSTAALVPSPPSASLTIQTKRDHALSDIDSGSEERTPTAPSAATIRVEVSNKDLTSDSSTAAPNTAILVSLSTNLRRRFAKVTNL